MICRCWLTHAAVPARLLLFLVQQAAQGAVPEGVQQQAGTPARQQQQRQRAAAADTAAAALLLLLAAAVDMWVAAVLWERGVQGMGGRGAMRPVGSSPSLGGEQTSCSHCPSCHSAAAAADNMVAAVQLLLAQVAVVPWQK
jgi:hypothetical protein